MEMNIILGIPVILALAAAAAGRQRSFGVVNAFGYAAVFLASARLLWTSVCQGMAGGRVSAGVDGLSTFFIFVTAGIGFAASLYSIGYISRDVDSGVISERKAGVYYLLFNLFCLSMFVVPAVDNLGVLWVAVEMTTLVSAFLVGFYNNKASVEAAWKYIIICSVGIIFALLGTILFYYAFVSVTGVRSLDWSRMALAAGMMDKNIVRLAFIFVLVGYGTKAGLAPMHTWLPDAHSQAVSPISALLSGVLLKTALYAILRFGIIVIRAAGFEFFANLMILFGIVSLALSAGFILVQKDLKRLLAYSSIEHMGIIAIGFGLGTPLAAAGALLHIFSHACAKSLMFFGAGNIISSLRKHSMKFIHGAIAVMPFTGALVLLGVFALTGMPPFSLFVSELMIIMAAFSKGAYVTAGLLLLFLAVVFGAFVHHFGGMLFGKAPKEIPVRKEPLSSKLAFMFLFIQVAAAGAAAIFLQRELIWIAQGLY